MSSLLLKYGSQSAELREAFALSIRKLANQIVDWKEIRAMYAKRKIALSKIKGFRPIGVGESFQRKCAKTMNIVTGDDVKEVFNSDHLSSGAKAGSEASVHAMKSLFEEHCTDGWGLLLGDADNAFNRINRPAMLWNVRVFWSRCSIFLFNSYRGYALLIIKGSNEFILSKEGITQGDSLGMKAYGIGQLPLTRKLKNLLLYIQSWFADDSSCAGPLENIVSWIEKLSIEGPKSGYYLQLEKCNCIVHPDFEVQANNIFSKLNVNVVTGFKFIGGFIGSDCDTEKWLI